MNPSHTGPAASGSIVAAGSVPDGAVLAAQRLAEQLLGGIDSRLAHSRGVAAQARRAQWLLPPPWDAAIVPAAWLHDIGYAELAAATGLHQLDGARRLLRTGWPTEVCRLVAWHTDAGIEARLRDLDGALGAEFEPPMVLAARVLAWADLTTSPLGEAWTADGRIAEILQRYPTDSVAHRAMTLAQSELLCSVRAIESALLNGAGSG